MRATPSTPKAPTVYWRTANNGGKPPRSIGKMLAIAVLVIATVIVVYAAV